MRYSYVKDRPTTMQKFAEVALAAAFITELAKNLDPAELELSVRKNAAPERDTRACHLQDYADANQLMLDAFGKVFPDTVEDEEVDLDITAEPFALELYNNAWRIASRTLQSVYQG